MRRLRSGTPTREATRSPPWTAGEDYVGVAEVVLGEREGDRSNRGALAERNDRAAGTPNKAAGHPAGGGCTCRSSFSCTVAPWNLPPHEDEHDFSHGGAPLAARRCWWTYVYPGRLHRREPSTRRPGRSAADSDDRKPLP